MERIFKKSEHKTNLKSDESWQWEEVKVYNSCYQTTVGKFIQWESGVQNKKGESYSEKI